MAVALSEVKQFLMEFAPLDLAEEWDNAGLLLGDAANEIQSVMTCLTLTPDVAEEAIQREAHLVVAHHPLFFRPVQNLTSDTIEGNMVLRLLRRGIGVYSPHTAFDSARLGINRLLAERLELRDIEPLRPAEGPGREGLGAGRMGTLTQPLRLVQFLQLVRTKLSIPHLQYTGDADWAITRVGIACGSAGELLADAHRQGCDAFLTGEARFHTCLDAQNLNVALVLAGHYATERPGVEFLSEELKSRFPGLQVWASQKECDPVLWSLG